MPKQTKGKSANTQQLEQPFPFEKLPAELRETIYELTFVRGSVRITRHTRGTDDKRIVAKETYMNWRGKEGVKKRFLHKQGTSILRVNRATYNEALSVLYGKNKFVFTSLPALRQLIRESPTGMHLLHHMVIHANGMDTFGPAMRKLHGVENLRTMEIRLDHCALHESRINAFVPAICAFVRRKEDELEQRAELDKITFVVESYRTDRYPGMVSRDEAPNVYKQELHRRFENRDKWTEPFDLWKYKQAKWKAKAAGSSD